MLATPAADGRPPVGESWAYEVKWDGVRALADVGVGGTTLTGRSGRDVTAGYPELAGLAAVGDVLLDGEIVAMADGTPSFAAVVDRVHVRDPARLAVLAREHPVTYVVFDLLRRDGRDLLLLPYDERRDALESLDLPGRVQLSPRYDDGAALWQVTGGHGLEGVVAKRRSSTYQPGRRSPDWVKAAHRRTRAALVGGWREESGGTGRLGAVLLGAPDDTGALRYLGRAGSGLTGADAAALRSVLQACASQVPPFDDDVPAADRRGAHWCRPVVVLDVTYLVRTGRGRLRQPVVRGVRDDVPPDPWERP
jgi:bifunctional non-homologous end joining protein LigD